jgi:signal transduction histidine kinase
MINAKRRRYVLLGFAAYLLVYISWQAFGWLPGNPSLISDLAFQPLVFIAAWAAWAASRRCRAAPRLRRAWLLIALGMLSYALGEMGFLIYENVLHQSPYPSIADPLYLLFYPLTLAGLLTLAGGRSNKSQRVRLGLDLGTVALGGVAVIWYFVLGPTAVAGGEGGLQSAFSAAYPVADMLLMVGIGSVLLRGVGASARNALWVLTAGFCFLVLADVIYGHLALTGSYSGGDPLDVLYMVARVLFACGAVLQGLVTAADGAMPQAARPERASWLPYAAVGAGFALLAYSDRNAPFFPDVSLMLVAVLLAALVSIRQLLVQRDLIAVQRELRGAHDELARAYEAEKQMAAEREQIEMELRLAQKLESVGHLAAGIAHEINTPIQFVGDTTQFLDSAFEDLMQVVDAYAELHAAARLGPVPAELLARVAEAEETADLDYLRERVPAAFERSADGLGRVATIVGAMREFAHPPTSEKAPVDINQAIRSTLVVAANEYRYVADLTTDLGDIPDVVCNAGDINQVLINLVVNAAHAVADVVGDSTERGTIGVTTRADGEEAVITISDSGGGIPAEVAERIFDPFFTTKEVGRGTGQGLAISRAIVERHNGSIAFESKPGEGTTFAIHLPLREHAAAPEALLAA